MAKLTYDDFKQRLSIQDVLVDAGLVTADAFMVTSSSSPPMASAVSSHPHRRTIMS